MNNEIKTRWVEALRSDKYSQTKGYLKVLKPDGTCSHCCLGVLCEIEGLRESEDGYYDGVDIANFYYKDDTNAASIMLAETFLHDIDLSDEMESTLASMNDDGSSFAEIADYIEENL